MQIEGGKEILQGYVFALDIVHHSVSIYSVGLLDEAQKMLLVHAGSSMNVSVDLQTNQKCRTKMQTKERSEPASLAANI